MSRALPEADWKAFRKLHAVALERFCTRVIAELQAMASENAESHHDRYLRIFKLLKRRDDELAHAFDGLRRSSAVAQLGLMHRYGLVTEEEMSAFTMQTRTSALHWSGSGR